MNYIKALFLCVLLIQTPVFGKEVDRKIQFPDIPGYLTLKCDLHQHTVFSDGKVWPSIRVEEAEKDGLDAVSMTDHIEYLPHKEDIPVPNRNRSFEVAKNAAKGKEIVVVNGSEITRSMPPGHANAIFLNDANALVVDDPIEAFRAAKKQGAFIFWNHPHWPQQAPDGIARLTEMHHQLIREGLLQGIEVVNDVTYSDEALRIALDHNLTIMSTSDIHGLIDWQYDVPGGGHRPVTLVFAKEKSAESIKEALIQRRTVAWFNNTLIGREGQILPLLEACLKIKEAKYQSETSVLNISIENRSDATFILENLTPYTLHQHADILTLEPHDTTKLHVKTLEKLKQLELKFRVLNAVTAPSVHPTVSLDVEVSE